MVVYAYNLRLRYEDHEFEASLGDLVCLYVKINKQELGCSLAE